LDGRFVWRLMWAKHACRANLADGANQLFSHDDGENLARIGGAQKIAGGLDGVGDGNGRGLKRQFRIARKQAGDGPGGVRGYRSQAYGKGFRRSGHTVLPEEEFEDYTGCDTGKGCRAAASAAKAAAPIDGSLSGLKP
jgi:hypothetical protein